MNCWRQGWYQKETLHNSSRYEITQEGEDTLEFFGKKISPAIIEDIDQYLKENKFRLRDEVGVVSDYYKSTSQDYIVHCEVREGKSVLIELNLSVARQGAGRIYVQPVEGKEPGDLRLCHEIPNEQLRLLGGAMKKQKSLSYIGAVRQEIRQENQAAGKEEKVAEIQGLLMSCASGFPGGAGSQGAADLSPSSGQGDGIKD